MIVTSGEASLHVEVTGHNDAPPILFLHAGVSDGRSWRHVVERLSSTHRCLVFDARQFGRMTFQPQDQWSYVDDAVAVLDATNTPAARVVACSMGGATAIELALDHPDRVESLVLIGSACEGAPYPELEGAAADLEQAEITADEASDIDELVRLAAHMWLDGPEAPGRASDEARAEFEQQVAISQRASDPGPMRPRIDSWLRLGEITVPALVLCGTLDMPDILHTSPLLADGLGNASMRWLDGVAHVPHLENHQPTIDAIAEFVSGQ